MKMISDPQKTTALRVLVLLAFLMVVMSMNCGADLSKNLGKIRRVQTISIIAVPPEARPGETVTLSALSVNPHNWPASQERLSYYWAFFYLDPSADIDITLDPTNLDLADLAEFITACPGIQGCELEFGPGNPRNLTLPGRDPENGEKFISYSVFLLAADSDETLVKLLRGEEVDGKFDLAAKGIKASESEEMNRNPVIEEVSVSGAISFDATGDRYLVHPDEEILFSALASDPDGDDIAFRWWIIEGRLEENNLVEVTWESPGAPGVYPVYLVVRDKTGDEPKGGQAAIEVVVEVVEP